MSPLKLLILDANIVIKLFEIGCWERLVERCGIHLSRAVAEQEAVFFLKEDCREEIDLSRYVTAGQVQVFDVSLADVQQFRDRFDPVYLEKLDPGETESLAYLLKSDQDYLISSSDAIVYRILGAVQRGHQGISLEEILEKTGLRKPLPSHYTRQFRVRWTSTGEREMIQGVGLRKDCR